MPGQEPRKGNAPGRAVKVGEPGGRLAEELKVMQVSASAQGGKNVGSFHNKVLFRYYLHMIIILLLWRGWLHLAVAATGDRSHGAHSRVCKAALQRSKIEN